MGPSVFGVPPFLVVVRGNQKEHQEHIYVYIFIYIYIFWGGSDCSKNRHARMNLASAVPDRESEHCGMSQAGSDTHRANDLEARQDPKQSA